MDSITLRCEHGSITPASGYNCGVALQVTCTTTSMTPGRRQVNDAVTALQDLGSKTVVVRPVAPQWVGRTVLNQVWKGPSPR